MAVLTTEFEVPCTSDRALIAIQDVIDNFKWMVLEVSPSFVVVSTGATSALQAANFPKISARLRDRGERTHISATISNVGPFILSPGLKSIMAGRLGQFVNSVSLRVQTKSISINPTVSIGEGQGQSESPPVDRLSQLETLKRLLDSGALTQDEFDREKARILNS